jgi:hypothetical protein
MINPKVEELAQKAFVSKKPAEYYLQVKKELDDFWNNEATEEDKKTISREWRFESLAIALESIKFKKNNKE